MLKLKNTCSNFGKMQQNVGNILYTLYQGTHV